MLESVYHFETREALVCRHFILLRFYSTAPFSVRLQNFLIQCYERYIWSLIGFSKCCCCCFCNRIQPCENLSSSKYILYISCDRLRTNKYTHCLEVFHNKPTIFSCTVCHSNSILLSQWFNFFFHLGWFSRTLLLLAPQGKNDKWKFSHWERFFIFTVHFNTIKINSKHSWCVYGRQMFERLYFLDCNEATAQISHNLNHISFENFFQHLQKCLNKNVFKSMRKSII